MADCSYGKRGGRGPNAGKRSAVYVATAPDGTELKKRTFETSEDEAVFLAYRFDGVWYANSVHAERPVWFRESEHIALVGKKV